MFKFARLPLKLKTMALSALAVLTVSAGLATAPEQANAASWNDRLNASKGQDVYWAAWGGGDVYNNYIDWVKTRVLTLYGIKLHHVKLGDTAEAVRTVIAEKSAGNTDRGSIDLIWINGENFKDMKDNGLLYGPFTQDLPNFALVDPVEKPTTVLDFTVPTDGYESPWGMAKLVFLNDTAVLKNLPRSIPAILEYAKSHEGRFTFPAPPDFTGSTFLKQALFELVDDPSVLLEPAGDNFDAVTAPLWAWLDELTPHLWRQGKDYPKTGAAQIRLLNDGEVDIAMSFNIGEASSAIADGRLPDTVRTFVLDKGTIGNTHFVAIPFNASHVQAAEVVANFLLSPEAQARKSRSDIWGEQTVLSLDRLSAADRKLFEDIPRNPATLGEAELGKTLPEPHPSWMTRIEERWLARYGS